jgi:hypothetical protein
MSAQTIKQLVPATSDTRAARRRWRAACSGLLVAGLIAAAGVAHADGPYAVLSRPNASWTYAVLDAQHRPTGETMTMSVSAVTVVGPYTEVAVESTMRDDNGDPLRVIRVPTRLAKGSKRVKLDRFNTEDRDYKVTVTVAKPDKHTWRVTWKGTYAVPEELGPDRPYKASSDFDPDLGFTQFCVEDGTCFKLTTP